MLHRLPLLLLPLLAVLWLTAPADAARRSVPREWLGATVDGPLTRPGADLDPEWRRMASTGVERARLAVFWDDAQPYASRGDVPADDRRPFTDAEGVPTDLRATDALVAAAARRHIRILPVVQRAPGWAMLRPGRFGSPPSPEGMQAYGRFLRALVARYGPAGTLWRDDPALPKMAIRDWQVWNEPNLTAYWSEQPFAARFVDLMRIARGALRAADPGARAVLAGLTNDSPASLKAIYAAGGRGTFDAVALHPYTKRPENVVRLVRMARRVMDRAGDRRVPITLTEVSWTSAARTFAKPKIGIEVTPEGQAARLRSALRLLAAARRRLRIDGVYWYTWITRDSGSTSTFDYAGLRRVRGRRIFDTPALRAYRTGARRLEGCAKDPGDASRCR